MTGATRPPLPPSDSPIPVVGSLPSLRHGLLEAFVQGWRKHGDIVLYRVPRPMIVFAHPDYVQHFFNDHHDHHPRSWLVRERLEDIMAGGLFSHDGEDYHRDLRMIEPALEAQRAAALEGATIQTTSEMLDRWDAAGTSGRTLDVHAEMQRLNLDIMGRVLFGAEWSRVGEVMRPAATAVYNYLIPRVTGFPTPLDPLFPPHRRYRRHLDTLDRTLYAAIAERRRKPSGDLISLFANAKDERTGAPLSDREVRTQLTTMIFGFFKSVGNTLTWTWYLLSLNPGPRRRLVAELEEVLGGRAPTVADLSRLRYAGMVLAEVLRLYPPLYIIARPPRDDEVVGGYLIPSDMFCLFLPYITHRHPAAFDNPEAFDPERFTPERSKGRHPYAYYPFAIGPRKCPGEAFGMSELLLILAIVARRYRLDLVPGRTVVRLPPTEFLLRPVGGLPMTLGRLDVSG